MDDYTDFDSALDRGVNLPLKDVRASENVYHRIGLCKDIASSIFGDNPPPHVVFDVYRFVIEEMTNPSVETEV